MLKKLDIIKQLKTRFYSSNVNHMDEILKQETLKDAHIYCILNNLSPQKYGFLLENYIKKTFGYENTRADEHKGDLSKDDNCIEVKVSLGGQNNNRFNFVQLRPFHKCNEYLFTAYHLSSINIEDAGELYIFKIPTYNMKYIISSYGQYAHGTRKKHGNITLKSLNDKNNNKEYALRPKFGDKCWRSLLRFRIDEIDI